MACFWPNHLHIGDAHQALIYCSLIIWQKLFNRPNSWKNKTSSMPKSCRNKAPEDHTILAHESPNTVGCFTSIVCSPPFFGWKGRVKYFFHKRYKNELYSTVLTVPLKSMWGIQKFHVRIVVYYIDTGQWNTRISPFTKKSHFYCEDTVQVLNLSFICGDIDVT